MKLSKIINKKQKAVSPLITVILLVVVATIFATLILNWSTFFSKSQLDSAKQENLRIGSELECMDVQFIVSDFEINKYTKDISFTLQNNSNLDIYGVRLTLQGRDTNESKVKLVGLFNSKINAGNYKTYDINDSDFQEIENTNISNLDIDKIDFIDISSLTCSKINFEVKDYSIDTNYINNPTSDILTNLVGYWKFDDVNAISVDDSINNNDLFIDTRNLSSFWSKGSNFAVLDTDTAMVIADDNYLNPKSNDWSLSFWLNLDDFNQDGSVMYKKNLFSIIPTIENKLFYSFEESDLLINPEAVAVNDKYVFVAGTYDNKIHKLDKKTMELIGKHKFYISSSGVGDSSGSIYSLYATNDYLYVLNTSNYLYVFDVETMEKLHSYYLYVGSTDEQISSPYGIYIDGNYIYVADYGYDRIKKHNVSDLSYVTHIGGTANGTGQDQFYLPRAITAKNGYVYVADTYNHRLKKHNASDLSFVSMVGSYGSSGDDYLRYPQGITVDDNYVYIADTYNHRIKKHTVSDLGYVESYGHYGTDENGYNYITDLEHDDNYFYVIDKYGCRIKKVNYSDFSLVDQFGVNHNDGDRFINYDIRDVTGDENYLYLISYVNLSKIDKNTLEVIDSISGFNNPFSIVEDGDYLYIAGGNHHKIYKYNKSDLSQELAVGNSSYGSGDDEFYYPRGIGEYGDYIYVADSYNHRIQKRNKSDLSLVKQIGAFGNDEYLFYRPYGVSADENYVYVADSYNSRLKIYTLDLNYVDEIYYSTEDYYFSRPYDVSSDENYIYLAGFLSNNIVIFDKSDFSYVTEIENLGVEAHNNNYIEGLGLDDDYIYIASGRSNSGLMKYRKSDHEFINAKKLSFTTMLSSEIIPSQYNLITITFDSDNETINTYVNGIKDKFVTNTKDYTYLSAHDLIFGQDLESEYGDIRVYNSLLSDSDVNAIYNANKHIFENNGE